MYQESPVQDTIADVQATFARLSFNEFKRFLVYPLERTQIVLQTQAGQPQLLAPPHTGVHSIFIREGIRALFKGFWARIFRILPETVLTSLSFLGVEKELTFEGIGLMSCLRTIASVVFLLPFDYAQVRLAAGGGCLRVTECVDGLVNGPEGVWGLQAALCAALIAKPLYQCSLFFSQWEAQDAVFPWVVVIVAVTVFITHPFEVATTRLFLEADLPASDRAFDGLADYFAKTYAAGGLSELYAGLSVRIVVRLWAHVMVDVIKIKRWSAMAITIILTLWVCFT